MYSHFLRKKNREERKFKIRNHFKDTKLEAAVDYWNNKLQPALTSKENVHRPCNSF